MGLFSKFGHGGVKVHVQAPSSIPSNQVIPVTVTISADSTHTIKSVKAEIKAQAREQGIGIGIGGSGIGIGQGGFNNAGVEEGTTAYQTIAQVESREPLSVGPGEVKTVNLQLYIDGSAGSSRQLGGANNASGVLGGALRAIANVAGNLDHVNYIYRVYASADVEGVALNPSDHQPIQILPPQEQAQTAQPTINNLQATQPASPQAPIGQPPVAPDQNNENPQS
jgi:hypothetical protein